MVWIERRTQLIVALCVLMFLAWRGCCFKVDPDEGDYTHGHRRLLQGILNETDIKYRIIPLTSSNKTVFVEFGFVVINIVEVNAKSQFITIYGWIRQKWNNSFLAWDPDEYGGVDFINVNPKDIWVPDILLFNNIDHEDRFAGGRTTYKTNVILRNDGLNQWDSPALFKLVCQINVSYFPLDEQTCYLKFGSWSYDSSRLRLQPMNLKFPSKYYTQNGEWRVNNMTLCRRPQKYQGSSFTYDHVVLSMTMRRVANDYLINLIIPCCLISSMIFLGFILPPESGERIGLSITVLLAMTVFQQLTSEIMPSYDFPILGKYYFAIVLEISMSIVATTLILNFYHRTHRQMPYLLKKVVLHWTSRLVFLHDEVDKLYNKNCNNFTIEESRTMHDNNFDNKSKEARRKSFRKSTMRRGRSRNEGCTGIELDKYSDLNDRYSNEQSADVDTTQALYGINMYPSIKMSVGLDSRDMNSQRCDQGSAITEEESELRKSEWTLVARTLDRFVLVVSIVIGFVTVAAVFLRAPALWSKAKPITRSDPVDIADLNSCEKQYGFT